MITHSGINWGGGGTGERAGAAHIRCVCAQSPLAAALYDGATCGGAKRHTHTHTLKKNSHF